MQIEYYLYAGSVVEGIHLLHLGGLELVFAVQLSASLNSTSLPTELNFLTVFIYIAKVSLPLCSVDLF